MVKRIVWLALAAALCLGGSACNKKKTAAEQKREKEIKWREGQKQKAIKYYGELIKNYPESAYSKQAEEKLKTLGPAATPAKKK